jgi:hypothetical protein
VPIHPVDEEDRILTEEIFAKQGDGSLQPEKEFEMPVIHDNAVRGEGIDMEDESSSPIDLDRVAEIRNLYLQAVETLDLK